MKEMDMSDNGTIMTEEAIDAFVNMVDAAEKTAAAMGQTVARTIEIQLRMVQAIQKQQADEPDEKLRAIPTNGKVQ